MTLTIDFVDAAAEVLAGHATYIWNSSRTRIRCQGAGCAVILDAPDDEEATLAFARHQAEQLPPPSAENPALHSIQSAPPHHVVEATPDTSNTEDSNGETMATAVTETVPKIRRDTKALAAIIAEIKKGDRVTAYFKHPRYGEFAVEGTVLKGGAGLDRNQLIVGGWYLNVNERAAKHLQELIVVARAGKHEFDIPKPSESSEHVGIGN